MAVRSRYRKVYGSIPNLKVGKQRTMSKFPSTVRALGFALTLLWSGGFAANTALAQGIEKFFGHFEGSGISENADSIYFAVSVRDLNIKISPAANGGFTLDWTTVTREKGDPNNPKVKRKQAALTFYPSGKPGVYKSDNPGDPIDGAPIWWSRVDEDSLYTYRMQIMEDGAWRVQKYIRTVSGAGMSLIFESIEDGAQVRQVKARLVKVGN